MTGSVAVAKALFWTRAICTSIDFLHWEKFLTDTSTTDWSSHLQPLMLISASHGKAVAHTLDPWERLAAAAALHILSIRSQRNPLVSYKCHRAVRSLDFGAWDLSQFCWAPSNMKLSSSKLPLLFFFCSSIFLFLPVTPGFLFPHGQTTTEAVGNWVSCRCWIWPPVASFLLD